jgi:hypothetical protein
MWDIPENRDRFFRLGSESELDYEILCTIILHVFVFRSQTDLRLYYSVLASNILYQIYCTSSLAGEQDARIFTQLHFILPSAAMN